MKFKSKSKFWRIFFWMVIVFILMFLFRLSYGYLAYESGNSGNIGYDFFNNVSNLRKNYASEKMAFKQMKYESKGLDNIQQNADYASGQKYEKIATVKSKTSNYDSDEEAIRKVVKSFDAIIQYEQNSGSTGQRELQLMLGVTPDKFDAFYLAIQKIGSVKSKVVTKTDKTNEYRQLNAQKLSLEKTLASLNELKGRPGAVADFIGLHDKILEIESRLQELGVDLGNFDSENEFCTVRFSLYEGTAERKIGFPTRMKVALEWTIKYYCVLMAGLFAAALVSFIILLIIDKLNVIKIMSSKMKE
jgi:hypothetical protein